MGYDSRAEALVLVAVALAAIVLIGLVARALTRRKATDKPPQHTAQTSAPAAVAKPMATAPVVPLRAPTATPTVTTASAQAQPPRQPSPQPVRTMTPQLSYAAIAAAAAAERSAHQANGSYAAVAADFAAKNPRLAATPAPRRPLDYAGEAARIAPGASSYTAIAVSSAAGRA